MAAMNVEVEQLATSDQACQRLRQIPEIGPLLAAAIVAAIGNYTFKIAYVDLEVFLSEKLGNYWPIHGASRLLRWRELLFEDPTAP
jgi:hypothetical protein